MSGAKGVPTEWLEGSPFRDYFIPSLILFVVVGGSILAAAIAVFARFRMVRLTAFTSGVILFGWLAVQIATFFVERDRLSKCFTSATNTLPPQQMRRDLCSWLQGR
jgi:hypothetical protein